MTRKLLIAVAALCACLTVLPAAPASAASTRQIIRDCSDDGVLQGTYTAAELRKARNALDGDVLEYTDCLDVLRRAELALQATAAATPSGTAAGAMPGVGTSAGEPDPNNLPTQFDASRLQEATNAGNQPVEVGGVKLVPASGVRVDKSALPTSLLVSLAILFAVGLAAVAPGVREKVPGLPAALRRLRRR